MRGVELAPLPAYVKSDTLSKLAWVSKYLLNQGSRMPHNDQVIRQWHLFRRMEDSRRICAKQRDGREVGALGYGYPPDKQEKATQTVLEQTELLCHEWAA